MSPDTNNNTRGIWLMILSMGAFAIADTIIKFATGSMAVAHTILLLMGGGFVIFLSLALINRETLISRAAYSPVMLVRYVAEICGSFGIVLALSTVPLSTVGAILQATPLVVAAGAVLFLGEIVSWRRWSAIGIGFLGVLLIIRPGTADFDANVLWPVLAMAGLAGRDLTTRLTPRSVGSATLATYTMAAALPVALLWVSLTQDRLLPAEFNWFVVLGMIGFGAVGYLLIIASVRSAEVSVVSPFRYSRLLFLLILGMIFFGERPDFLTLLGAAIIILSGIYTMWRDRLAKQNAG